ncbi:MAG: DNA polymerase domain-containing protein [Polyangiaceae bacterium]
MGKKEPPKMLEVAGHEVRITSPSKVYFPDLGLTKLELVRYYLTVAEGAVRGICDRPIVLKRFVNGIGDKAFFQKRAPKGIPEYVSLAELRYPSGRSAKEVVVDNPAALAWIVSLGCIDLNPHPVRADDLEHPDELRVDLDPGPGATWEQVRRVAMVAGEVLEEMGLVGWPKTSGSRGIHILVRIERAWTFTEVRKAAQAVAREVAHRIPEIATARWWKEERHGVFLDYNQNARDRTVASAYSVRPVKDARVSAPVTWEEVPRCQLADFTVATMPARWERLGDLHAGIDQAAGSLTRLLERYAEQEADGWGDEAVEKMPLVVVSKAETKDEALAGLERWKARHEAAASALTVEDVLVDPMRGRSSMWYRVRVNLRHVPEEERPEQETPDPDYDPWAAWRRQREAT